jgi:hypothetical protein
MAIHRQLGASRAAADENSPAFGNRNLFFEWKNRAMAQGKVRPSNGKYCRAFSEQEVVN